jgi:hypothetical protein
LPQPASKSTPLGKGSKPESCWYRALWCVFSPFILIWHSIDIYLLPCVRVYIHKVCGGFCFRGVDFLFGCFGGCKHKDSHFAGVKALGAWHDKSEAELEKDVVWLRANEICADKFDNEKSPHMFLFTNGVTAEDVCQGQLGDCWLMSALACLSEFPGTIERIFLNQEYSYSGKYSLRLFDGKHQQWEKVTVDDHFPCGATDRKPIFAQPQQGELWVLVLEKAFAKFCGSYQGLSGGHALWALEALTGDKVCTWHLASEGGEWKRLNLRHFETDEDKRKIGLANTDEAKNEAHMFKLLQTYDREDAAMAASSKSSAGSSDTKEDSNHGIVPGHAYTFRAVAEVGGVRLVQLRNPWGSFEWTGDWSDDSPLWKQHPKVASACGVSLEGAAAGADDGLFWMSWEDFPDYFGGIDVCNRSVGLEDLQLDVREQVREREREGERGRGVCVRESVPLPSHANTSWACANSQVRERGTPLSHANGRDQAPTAATTQLRERRRGKPTTQSPATARQTDR